MQVLRPCTARSPDSEAWRQAYIVETKGPVHINEPIADDAFTVALPGGTRVSDEVQSAKEKSGEDAFASVRNGRAPAVCPLPQCE